MFIQRGSRVLRRQIQASKAVSRAAVGSKQNPCAYQQRWFRESRRLMAVKPVLLADIGEGIVECEVIQWFVTPGAQVEEFSPLCEVQSDKASVEITSRFTGTVKKLYYEAGEMAKVGKAFIDIDIQEDVKSEDVDAFIAPEPGMDLASQNSMPASAEHVEPEQGARQPTQAEQSSQSTTLAGSSQTTQPDEARKPKGKMSALATPAVRHLSKELKVDIADIDGTGRDGRVLKEDIYNHVKTKGSSNNGINSTQSSTPIPSLDTSVQTETPMQLSKMQQQMFKSMTRSLQIPHFLYADEVDFSSLVELRGRLNKVLSKSSSSPPSSSLDSLQPSKLSYLPFIIKAVSMALYQFPTLNARVDIDSSTPNAKPSLILRSQHNIGVAMDTPQGLVVPVIKNVGSLNVLSIAAELARLQSLASQGKLSLADMSGGTITVSNIGNIGGTYLSPVIVEREVAILGIGRMRTVPAFDEKDKVVKKQVCNFSWSADHRVIDGATMARAADVVRSVVEEPDVMVMHLR